MTTVLINVVKSSYSGIDIQEKRLHNSSSIADNANLRKKPKPKQKPKTKPEKPHNTPLKKKKNPNQTQTNNNPKPANPATKTGPCMLSVKC